MSTWRWTARRIFVSAFVAGHLAATVVWVLPLSDPGPLR